YTIPIQFYLGWISVATIANITALLVHYGIVGSVLNQIIWTIVMMSIGGLLGVLMLLKYNAIAYSLVIVWAYIGIIIKRTSSIPIHNEIIIAAYIIIGIIFILMVRSFIVLLKKKTT
ncbi:MAG: tryptophan-rich sensory protein, partial [Spirochaetes bacterium]|nr:tryptophan-rich sensory protein [Spirochaetota bacterium]